MLLGFEDETWLHLQPYITRTYMRRGKQQKILHKGSKKKVNVFITLLYPLNGIKFNTSKTRNSSDFIHHLNSIEICKKKEHQEIHTCNRQCIISCKQKDKTIYRKTIKLVNSIVKAFIIYLCKRKLVTLFYHLRTISFRSN